MSYSCDFKQPVEVAQSEMMAPRNPATIDTTGFKQGEDYSVGYYNGTIRTDRVKLEWQSCGDPDFLFYKIFNSTNPEGSKLSEGFESGSLPENWSTYGDNGWFVTDSTAYDRTQ